MKSWIVFGFSLMLFTPTSIFSYKCSVFLGSVPLKIAVFLPNATVKAGALLLHPNMTHEQGMLGAKQSGPRALRTDIVKESALDFPVNVLQKVHQGPIDRFDEFLVQLSDGRTFRVTAMDMIFH